MRRLAASCLCLVLAGCSEDPPDSPDIPPGTVEPITGNERIGWLQRGATFDEVASLRYNIYVDGTPGEAQGVACEQVPTADGFPCSAALPPMSRGRHTLQLTSFLDAGSRLESGRSSSLVVQVGQGVLPGVPAAPEKIITADGIRLVASPLTSGLDDPRDLAVGGGRVFIAERQGRIQVFRDGGGLTAAIEIDDVDVRGQRGLLSIALDPEFEKTGHLFAAYTTEAGFRLVRYRAVGDTLGDRVTLVDGVEAPSLAPSAVLRFGPDGKLYLALDDGGVPARAGDLGSFNGKVLRLNLDGTTPPDQAGGTPVYALNVNAPRGLDWDNGALWIAEAQRLQAVVSTSAPRRAVAIANYNLPPDLGSGPLLMYRGPLVPGLVGDLLLAGDQGRAVLRLRLDPDNRRAIASTEYLLRDVPGGVQALAAGADGLVYFCSAGDLYAITPDPADADPRPKIQM
jgi:glucose/arabinose dehydrogenase